MAFIPIGGDGGSGVGAAQNLQANALRWILKFINFARTRTTHIAHMPTNSNRMNRIGFHFIPFFSLYFGCSIAFNCSQLALHWRTEREHEMAFVAAEWESACAKKRELTLVCCSVRALVCDRSLARLFVYLNGKKWNGKMIETIS